MTKVAREWTVGVPKSDQKKIEDTVLHSSTLLDRLREIIELRRQSIAREEAQFGQYDNPNWSHRQAHLNGRKQELRELDALVTIYP